MKFDKNFDVSKNLIKICNFNLKGHLNELIEGMMTTEKF